MFSRRNCWHSRLWSGFENFTAMKSCVCPQKTIFLFFFLNVASLILAHALLFCFVNFSFVDGCMVDLYACDAIYDLVRARLGMHKSSLWLALTIHKSPVSTFILWITPLMSNTFWASQSIPIHPRQGVNHCHQVSLSVTKYHWLSLIVTKCHQMSYNVIQCHQVSPSVTKCQ